RELRRLVCPRLAPRGRARTWGTIGWVRAARFFGGAISFAGVASRKGLPVEGAAFPALTRRACFWRPCGVPFRLQEVDSETRIAALWSPCAWSVARPSLRERRSWSGAPEQEKHAAQGMGRILLRIVLYVPGYRVRVYPDTASIPSASHDSDR